LENSKIHFLFFDHGFTFIYLFFKIKGILIFIFVRICFECTITILNNLKKKKSEPNFLKRNKKKRKFNLKKKGMRFFFNLKKKKSYFASLAGTFRQLEEVTLISYAVI
jgi:hypothetical protein